VKTVLSLLLLVSLTACASSGDIDLMRQDINDLQRNSFEMQKSLDALRQKTDAATQELGSLKTGREGSIGAVRDSQAEINSRLTQISEDLQALRGRFEESKYYTEKTLKDAGTDRDLLRTQIQGLEAQVKALSDRLGGAPAATGTTTPQTQTGASEEQEKPAPTPAASHVNGGQEQAVKAATAPQGHPPQAKSSENDRVNAYDDAYQAFKEKKYKESRRKFESFIKDYPKNNLTDNAQFWIAETYYSEKDYEGAILAYETLLKKYPDSAKTSAAMLKQGLAFTDIGDAKTGTIILKRLIGRFPDSKEAAAARKKIAEIEKKPGRKN
jgi:tol-pal system protein YbgF